MERFDGKKIWIAGKGISGQGAYEALTSRGATCAFCEGSGDFPPFEADCIVVSPGIDSSQPIFTYARDHEIPLIGELELGYLLCDKPIVAVTGTNGKTTVTRLIGAILTQAGYKAAVCGNVGESFAAMAARGGFDYAVTEVSSFQLETIRSFRPHVAVITNLSADHLDRHKTLQAYFAAKRKIAQNQTAEDTLILSQDDIPLCALEHFMPKANVLYTSVRGKLRGAYLLDDKICYMGEVICDADRVRMEGLHNLKNALSAVCAAKALGIGNEPIVAALTSFEADEHRLELVAHKNGKNYYDDSKGTNIMASVCAAACMSGSTCMIVGGSDKGYEYDELFLKLSPSVVRVAAVGETADKVKAAALRCGFAQIETFRSFADAFAWANAGEEENVLLSPASASFDMFTSYVERGEAFARLVKDAD